MPVDYSKYPKNWKQIRSLILQREQHKCKFCGIENEREVMRVPGTCQWRYANESEMMKYNDLRAQGIKQWPALRKLKLTYIILTVAHLDQNINNNKFSNLAALCQKCHLAHDRPHHLHTRKYGNSHRTEHPKLQLKFK